jgi:hypothetical protein
MNGKKRPFHHITAIRQVDGNVKTISYIDHECMASRGINMTK